MTSTITQISSLINTNFPIPGVDNDTQGFRTNYINISNAFNAASNEITAIQIEQANVLTQLNNATIAGTEYTKSVTALVLNSLTTTATVMTPVVTIDSLPPAGIPGRRAFVTNSSTSSFGAVIITTSTGTISVPVFDNGTNWLVG